MTIYSVHNRAGASIDQAVFVPEGFSAGAAAFTVLWALWRRMWLVAAVLLVLMAALALSGLNENLMALGSLVISLIFGFEAQGLRAHSLVRAGYAQIGLSHGRNLEEAELRFYAGLAAPPAPPPVMARFTPATEPLGLFGNV